MEKRVIMIPFEVDGEWIDDVLCTAFEGGINYWCSNVTVVDGDYKGGEYKSEVISRGGRLKLYDESGAIVHLTLEGFIKGVEKYYEWCLKDNRKTYTDPGMIDAEIADCMVQFAVFGEIIYG